MSLSIIFISFAASAVILILFSLVGMKMKHNGD